MLFDIFVLTSFMCCFHEKFSSISTPRNLVTFSLSMTILFIFEKGSGSLKNLFFEAGWNREYVVFVTFSDNLFAERYFVKLSIHIRKKVIYVYAWKK